MASSYVVTCVGDVTSVTATAPGPSFLCHDEASVVEFFNRPSRWGSDEGRAWYNPMRAANEER